MDSIQSFTQGPCSWHCFHHREQWLGDTSAWHTSFLLAVPFRYKTFPSQFPVIKTAIYKSWQVWHFPMGFAAALASQMLVVTTHSLGQRTTLFCFFFFVIVVFFLIEVQIWSLKLNCPLTYKHTLFSVWKNSSHKLVWWFTNSNSLVHLIQQSCFIQIHEVEQGTGLPSDFSRNQTICQKEMIPNHLNYH